MPPSIKLSVSEAAKLFGISSRTVRRAIADNEIRFTVTAGRYKLDFANLLDWAMRTTTVRNKLMKHGVGRFVADWKKL